MLLRLLVTAALPIILSLIITPWVIRIAVVVGATDQPNERKIHKHPMPRIGGVAVYLSFFLSLLFLFLLDPALHEFNLMVPQKGVMLVASLLTVMMLGFWDDLKPLNPKQKFLVQIAAATMVYIAGFRISVLSNPTSDSLLNLGIFAYPVTIFWIVGITNAFNLIDGLDGLSSGVATIASLAMAAISYLGGDYATAFISLILAGALVGFLRYNFNPARIFLGDCGSLFIGFSIAVLSIQGSTKGSVAVSIIVPILALGLPIMDTLLSMIRRLIRSFLPKPEGAAPEPLSAKLHTIFLPDKAHIHHKLIARGHSHRTAVLLLYMVSCLFALGAFALTLSSNVSASVILVVIGVATLAGIRTLQYTEMAILRNGVLLPLYKLPLLRRTFFQGFLDLAFVAGAFTISYFIATHNDGLRETEHQFLFTLSVVSAIQLAVFQLSGLYKCTFEHIGLGDGLKIIKAALVAAACTWLFFSLMPRSWSPYTTTIVVMDFYFLLTFVAGVRLSYRALNFLFRRESRKGKTVLIYGATTNGILTLQQVLNDDSLNLNPIGFLDDNPQMEGMRVNDYPVFGGHWKLQGLLHRYPIDEILMATDNIKPAVFNRLKQIASRNNIAIKQTRLMLEDIPLIAEPEPAEVSAGEAPAVHSEDLSVPPMAGLELSKP